MRTELTLWLVLGGWAAALLLAMMRRRQQALDSLLRTYIMRETQSAARGRKSAQAAAKAAKNAAPETPQTAR